MTERVEAIRKYIIAKSQKQFRVHIDWEKLFAEKWPAENQEETRINRASFQFRTILREEAAHPNFIPDEKIVLTRHCENLPERYSDAEMAELRERAYFHEKGVVFNISPDYASTISVGLEARRAETAERRDRAVAEKDTAGIEFLDAVLADIDAVLDLADSYRQAAQDRGMTDVAAVLEQVPRYPARNFLEALQFFRILHFCMWIEGGYHNGVGRFDQFMFPYLQNDLERGFLTEESAQELLEEFFLTFNRDSDLYVGVQQGDNGQSLMLGGCDYEGNDATNLLTEMALKASCEMRLIDPKINLRVSSKTPLALLEKATELTKVGLGFPQYANDEVVIPGLTELGYDLKDARNYTVAACWEFIIPGCGMDIPNIGAVSFPAVVDRVLRSSECQEADSFADFMNLIRNDIFAEADKIQESLQIVDMLPNPYISLLCTGRIEAARDVSEGNKYNNFGIHGTGFAPAVDSIVAIKRIVFEEHSLSMSELVKKLDENFENDPQLLTKIRYEYPKVGNEDNEADEIGVILLDDFADSWHGRKNCRGGIFRAGTGSAMYYIWHANELPASPDGRLKGEPFPANFAPALNVQVKGPISVVKSFTRPHLKRVVNGGPLTIEIHDSTFRIPDGIVKVAQLVQLFILRGGHQLQINTINRDQLLAAQQAPQDWKHLIVRVWGWSGYFVELDKPYQDQIIKRAELVF